jgi:hypothetical protein
MKTRNSLLIISIAYLTLSFSPGTPKMLNLNPVKPSVKVTGTSTLHDWESFVKRFDCTANFTIENNSVKDIQSLTVNFYSNSFSSGKSAMDKKIYEALKTQQ